MLSALCWDSASSLSNKCCYRSQVLFSLSLSYTFDNKVCAVLIQTEALIGGESNLTVKAVAVNAVYEIAVFCDVMVF